MRYKKALLPTLKEAPADATQTSHRLLIRAGCMRQIGAGIYSFLPLGLRALRRVENLVREEMNLAGAQEVLLPALVPADYFKETGRWDTFGDALFRLQDRRAADCLLAPTHEEVMTDLARREIRSYKDLPQNLYQIQTKFRDEPRPRGGLLRGREFLMKDAYSFDKSEEFALISYEKMRSAYKRIFDRLGFNYRLVKADSGAMGGSMSTEFQVLVQSGEDFIAACPSCDYAANVEVASPVPPLESQLPQIDERESIHTPGKGSIEEVSAFLKALETSFFKSLVYKYGDEFIMVVLRGDHAVNEVKLSQFLGDAAADLHLATPKEVKVLTGSSIGFVGPVGFQGKILIDPDAAAIDDGICGALQTDHHLMHVQFNRDFQGEVVPLRMIRAGDNCPACGATTNAKIEIYRGIEAGHIFVLGTHYSKQMNAQYLDKDGEKKNLVMGCYGIGISRLVAAAVEQHHDSNGIIWPMALAPYPVHICVLGDNETVMLAVARIERELLEQGLEPLIDDRDVRPGVKFKDADLIGLPLRITVGERSLKEGKVELKSRTESDPKAAEAISIEEISGVVAERVREALSQSSSRPAGLSTENNDSQ